MNNPEKPYYRRKESVLASLMSILIDIVSGAGAIQFSNPHVRLSRL